MLRRKDEDLGSLGTKTASVNICIQQTTPLVNMADERENKSSKNDSKKDVFLPRSVNEIQKIKIEKLMKNPVG